MASAKFEPGPIACGGAAVNDFLLTDHLPPEAAAAVIERDRLHMAIRPGFNRKLLPIRVEPDSGRCYSGGRYLMDTYEDAQAYVNWLENEFELDGKPFITRPDFADIQVRVMHVLGAADFKDVRSAQHLCRTEIWSLDRPGAVDWIEAQWPALRDEAAEHGRSSLWLLYDDRKGQVCLFTASERDAAAGTDTPDFRGIAKLEAEPSQGAAWEQSGRASRRFDRTHWVFTIWFPRTGDQDVHGPLWPNSPPLPGA